MSKDVVRADLLGIVESCGDQKDGGYALAAALFDYRLRRPASTAHEWDQVLVEWARERLPRWGVALEALARARGQYVDSELVGMLMEVGRPQDWRKAVAHTLIRRGCCREEVKAFVLETANRRSPGALANLAALLVIAPDALPWAVDCIVDAICDGKENYIEGYVPAFVITAAKSDPEVLMRLVESVSAKDEHAGRRFGEMVVEYLDKPFGREAFAEGAACDISERLRKFGRRG